MHVNGTGSFQVLDLYSRWKDWLLLSDNIKYYQAFRYVGGDPTVGSDSLGITYFLTNGWRIQPFSANHRLQVAGNLFTNEGDSPFELVSGSFQVQVENKVSNLTDSTVVGLGDISSSIENIQTDVTYISASIGPIGDEVSDISGSLTVIGDEVSDISGSIDFLQTDIDDIQVKQTEVWELHGLNITKPLLVTQTKRTFGTVDQDIVTIGTGSAQQTTITRN